MKRTHQAEAKLVLAKDISPEQFEAMKREKFRQDLARKKAQDERLAKVRNMTHEEKARAAIDLMTKQRIDFDALCGKNTTEAEAREMVQKVADLVEQKRMLGAYSK